MPSLLESLTWQRSTTEPAPMFIPVLNDEIRVSRTSERAPTSRPAPGPEPARCDWCTIDRAPLRLTPAFEVEAISTHANGTLAVIALVISRPGAVTSDMFGDISVIDMDGSLVAT